MNIYPLSICMMVKDEERHLKDCLQNLMPLVEEINAELIIIDTGSTDKTVEIAKEFTERLFFHPWNHDFSGMRNKTISYARGEWIFIVDGDEVLEDTEELIQLFTKSKKILKNHNTIQVKITNYLSLDENKDTPAILTQPRLYRNDGEFRFEGTVHNQPKYKQPVYTTERTNLKHYGYITHDSELVEKKFHRTATLLKKELEKNPDDLYYNVQLAVSYRSHNDFQEALEQIRKAHKILNEKYPKEKWTYGYLFGIYANIALANKKIEECTRICKEGIEARPDHIDLYYRVAGNQLGTGQEKEAIKYFKKYLDKIKQFHSLPIAKDDTIVLYTYNKQCMDHARYCIAQYYINHNKEWKAHKYAQEIETQIVKTEILTKILLTTRKYRELLNYYKEIQLEKEQKELCITIIETEKKKLKENESKTLEEQFLSLEDEYGLLYKIKADEENNRSQHIIKFLKAININNIPSVYLDIFQYIMEDKKIFTQVFRQLTSLKMKQYMTYSLTHFKDVEERVEDYLLNENVRPNDFQNIRIYICIANAYLLQKIEHCKQYKEELEEEYYKIFEQYVERGISYVEQLYKLDKMRLIYKTMDNKEDVFFILMHFTAQAVEKKQYKAAIAYFKEAVKGYPYLAGLANQYKDKILQISEE